MPVQLLDDVTQDESGYRIHFGDAVIGVEQYDEIEAYALDIIERTAVDFLRACLVLRWLGTERLGESMQVSNAGVIITNG